MPDHTWTVWSRDDRTGMWVEVSSGLSESDATQQAVTANRRLGRDAYLAVPTGQEPGQTPPPAPLAPPQPAPPAAPRRGATGVQLRPHLGHITREEAAHVLHHYGEGGLQPGSFTRQLIATMAMADPSNLSRLARVFPGYAAAVRLARDTTGGVDTLRALARS